MDTLIQIGQIIFILSVLVVLHEFGHYVPAKLFKVRVEKFYLFMDAGFSIFKKKIKDTEWGIGWLPIGGYVKLAGMVDESMDKEQMALPPQPWEFRSKPAWQRLIIMLGGITVNIILAWFIYTVMFATVGQKYPSTDLIQKNGLAFGESGINAGFKNGDKIVSVDGKVQGNFKRLFFDVILGDKIEVERDGKTQTIVMTDEQKSKILGSEGKGFIAPRVALSSKYIDSVTNTDPKAPLNIKKGDEILGFNNVKFEYYYQFLDSLRKLKNQTVVLDLKRDTVVVNQEMYINPKGKSFLDSLVSISQKIKLENVILKTVVKESNAEAAGMKSGDQIVSIGGKQLTYYQELSSTLGNYKNKSVKIGVIRDGKNMDLDTKVTEKGKIGIEFDSESKNEYQITNHLSIMEAIPAAVNESYTQFVYNIKQFKLILKPKTGAYKQVKSPIGITQLLPTTWDWEFVWGFIAMFSIGLAFMNLLPIPGLDGGHAIFTIAEMITGKTLSVKAAERVQTVGMIILLSLMALTFGKDIYEIIAKKFL
ncbi:MAG: site-2 protease family protein [Flavobacterium sp.]